MNNAQHEEQLERDYDKIWCQKEINLFCCYLLRFSYCSNIVVYFLSKSLIGFLSMVKYIGHKAKSTCPGFFLQSIPQPKITDLLIQYNNYAYFELLLDKNYSFFYFYKYRFLKIVDLYLKSEEPEIIKKIQIQTKVGKKKSTLIFYLKIIYHILYEYCIKNMLSKLKNILPFLKNRSNYSLRKSGKFWNH